MKKICNIEHKDVIKFLETVIHNKKLIIEAYGNLDKTIAPKIKKLQDALDILNGK